MTMLRDAMICVGRKAAWTLRQSQIPYPATGRLGTAARVSLDAFKLRAPRSAFLDAYGADRSFDESCLLLLVYL